MLGIGFSSTPSQNTVTVNGVATVQTATATELVVCLATGTTTGPVMVTTPTGSDTSDGPLPVQAAAAVPTISGFTPIVTSWGAALSVSGTNFDASGRMRNVKLRCPIATMLPRDEVKDVLGRPLEDRPGREGSRVALGRTREGRYLRVIYVPDAAPNSMFVITAYGLGPKALRALRRRRRRKS